jgi:rhamnogalacturonan endolyase
MRRSWCFILVLAGWLAFAPGLASLQAARQIERLGRGLVVLRPTAGGAVVVSWRLLVTDPEGVGFHVYRAAGGAPAERLTGTPLMQATHYVDTSAPSGGAVSYFVRPVVAGIEGPASPASLLAAGASAPYLAVPLQVPAGGTTPSGESFTYSANDCSAGDLDGDGEYELVVKWDPSNSKDNSQSGYTGPVLIDAYRMNGTRLWRIDLGRNIRAGAHYTQFMVYDLDGDGRAELACKTADGTTDGAGVVIGSATADYRNSSGYILSGPEFLTVFDGLTGRALATTDYLPGRGNVGAWGDTYGNRVDRFLACVAYLDGERPSLVMCRGYYTRAVLVAWDWRGGQLTRRWTFDSDDGTPGNSAYRGEGNHNLAVADVDQDGRDEIVYGSCAIDDTGRGLYATGLHHGDALHVSDHDPLRPGLEVWACHEDINNNGGVGLSLRDARTGAVLFTVPNTTDTGRAIAMDIDPRHRGAECWGAAGGLQTVDGTRLAGSRPSSMNFGVWWDGDLLREILDSNRIDKWNWLTSTTTRLVTATDCTSNNGTKSTPALSADLLGDWREEVVWRTTDSRELRIYTTPIPTERRWVTLMQDPQYRLAVAWQNVAYNQPPHPGFFLGEGMGRPPTPLVRVVGAPEATTRLTNLSVRTQAGRAEETLIVGFALAGTGEHRVLIRGVGPALGSFGVSGVLADPVLSLHAVTGPLATNDNWPALADPSAAVVAAAQVGAFPLPPGGLDAVLVSALGIGGYTAHVTPATGTGGVALVEVYGLATVGPSRLVNASARARTGTGADTLIAGFALAGTEPRRVLVRAVGPGLARFGVAGGLADPRLAVYHGAAVLAQNEDWTSDSGVGGEAFALLGAFPLEPGARDSALLLNLAPGAYTVHATGSGNTGGIVLVEVYDAGG